MYCLDGSELWLIFSRPIHCPGIVWMVVNCGFFFFVFFKKAVHSLFGTILHDSERIWPDQIPTKKPFNQPPPKAKGGGGGGSLHTNQ